MNNKAIQFVLLIAIMAWAGCGPAPTPTDKNPASIHASLKPRLSNRVATVSYALQYLTQRIAGPEIEVDFSVGHRPSDLNWQPAENDVAILQQADLVITNGPGAVYANWLSRISVSDSKICNSCADLATRDYIMVNDHKIVHQHGPEGEHSHPFMVPYTWLDPAIAKKQAKKIAADLSQVYPDRANEFQKNYKSLANDLDELSNLLTIDKTDTHPVVISINPLLKFLTRAANLFDQHLLRFSNDDDTLKTQLDNQAKAIRESDPKLENSSLVLLIPLHGDYGLDEPQSRKYASEFGLLPCWIDTLDRKPASGDYLSVMKSNIENLLDSLRRSAAEPSR